MAARSSGCADGEDALGAPVAVARRRPLERRRCRRWRASLRGSNVVVVVPAELGIARQRLRPPRAHVVALPRARRDAERDQRREDAPDREVGVGAHPVEHRLGGARAERAAHVLLVVDEVPLALVADVGVERVDLGGVDVVHPRREDAVAAQVAPVLVRHAVVRIVACAARRTRTARRWCPRSTSSPGRAWCRRAQRRLGQHLPPALGVERLLVPLGVADGRLRRQDQVARPEVDDRLRRHVPAARPRQARDHHLRRRVEADVAGRVELDGELPPERVLDDEAEVAAAILALGHRQRQLRPLGVAEGAARASRRS